MNGWNAAVLVREYTRRLSRRIHLEICSLLSFRCQLKNADAGAGCRPPRARYATSCENWVQENPTKTDSQQPLAYRTSADFKARKDQWSNGGLHEIGFESDCQFGCSPKIQKHMFGFVYGCMRSK